MMTMNCECEVIDKAGMTKNHGRKFIVMTAGPVI